VNKALSERLKYYIEIFRLVWASLLLVGGGIVSLLLREDRNTVLVALAASGGALMLTMVIILLFLDIRIRKRLRQMEDQKNV